ncbi:hypothetical protein E2C01_080631 [Portunus trituberculatus]|uniref:Uncharacterized protein n=1 Tax=Portunus trituberculatus TaxID=210409 RepID=A0A5B7ITX5_PORTR|nr:hypothetical protein [Portunus trituberculatus]
MTYAPRPRASPRSVASDTLPAPASKKQGRLRQNTLIATREGRPAATTPAAHAAQHASRRRFAGHGVAVLEWDALVATWWCLRAAE